MNLEIKQAILNKIKEYSTIFLFRHVRNDGDCVGATKGLKAIITATWPEKQVYIIDLKDTVEYLAFMGPEDPEMPDEVYARSLGIVLDTSNEARISNKKYTLCRELIKIDHHIPQEQYGDLQWVEEHRSSCCEMVADLCRTFPDELVLTREAATHLYTGMVTDSGRFKHGGVTGETLRCAAALLDAGVDTQTLFARLYLKPFEHLKFKSAVFERIRTTPNGVAYIFVDKAMQAEFGLDFDQAAAVIDNLSTIRDCIGWLVFVETDDPDHCIRVRIRSRFVHTNSIAEKYHGGGHACASGAAVYSAEEMNALLADADALVGEYKATHEGWL